MILVIAEKPSVAQTVAAALGVKVNEVPALTLWDAPDVAVLTPEIATLSIRQPTDASVCG